MGEYVTKKLSGMTPEEKKLAQSKAREYKLRYRESRTPEQKQAVATYHKKRTKEMTGEQKTALRAYGRRRNAGY